MSRPRWERPKKKFTAVQPKAGDIVTHCGHMKKGGRSHFFEMPKQKIRRPDLTVFEAEWMVICDACWNRIGKDAQKVYTVICGDTVWKSNDPCIEEPPNEG